MQGRAMNRHRKHRWLLPVLMTNPGARQTDGCSGAMRYHIPIGALHYRDSKSGSALQSFDFCSLADTDDRAAI